MSRWPLHKAYFWQEAPLFRPLLPLLAGITCYDNGLPGGRHLAAVVIGLAICAVLLIALALIRLRAPLLDASQTLLLHVFFIAMGWSVYAASDARNQPDWFGPNSDTVGAYIVRIQDEPRQRAVTTRATVDVLYSLGRDRLKRVSGRALLYMYRLPGDMPFDRGDTLLIPGRWQPVRNSGNPFAFDNARFQRRKGILHQQFLAPGHVVPLGRARSGDSGFLEHAHNWCNHQLRRYIRDSTALGLLQAMLLGDESAFDPGLREAYSQTGVIHIVSISGSHVAVLFLVVTSLLYWIKGRHGAWVKYAVGVALVWMYVLIAGAPPSALRSAVMFTVIALSVVTNREGQSLNTVVGAALILLIGAPAWLFSVGFQLSFGAVLSILIFYQPIYRSWPRTSWMGKKLWQAVSASIAAEILTAPLVVYYFHNFPLLFILANLLSVILVGFCALVGGMAIIGLFWLPSIAAAIGLIISQLVRLFNAAIIELQHLNPPSFQYLTIDAFELLLIYIIVAALGVWWLYWEKAGLLIALATTCILAVMLNVDHFRALRQDRLIVYSSGRRPIVERTTGRHFFPLAGDSADHYDAKAAHIGWHAWRAGKGVAEPYLFIKNESVYLLTDTTINAYHSKLPVDVLVICRPLRHLQIAGVLEAFSPKKVVIAGRPAAYYLQRWTDSCAAHGIYLCNTAADGAFIMD